MGSNTPEYRAIIQSTSDVTNAVKNDIGPLGNELLSKGLISASNLDAATNPMIDASHRASQLVSLIRTKIQLSPGNFHKFVDALLTRASDHREILEILDHKYKALGGVKETGISATLASLAEQDHAAAQQVAPTVTRSASSAPAAIQPSSQQPQPESRSSSSSSLSAQQATTGGTVPTSGHVRLNDGMSDEQFAEWLRDSGMTQSEDRDKITGAGINAQSLPYLEEMDVKEVMGQLSLGGRGILRKLWRQYKISDEYEGSLTSHLDTELDKKVHYKITRFLKDVPANDLRKLGGALGLSRSKILQKPDDELCESIISSWLRMEDEVLSVGKPTLRVLGFHLKDIGQGGLAHEIASTNGKCILN